MRELLSKYKNEVKEFLNEYTLYEIDCGVLDYHNLKNMELKYVFGYLERKLALELEENYSGNDTGIFRVEEASGIWRYCEGESVIVADSLEGLKRQVLDEERIWYVFDEFTAERLMGN